MDQTERLIRRGENARQLLNDPLLMEAFEALEGHYVNTWKSSDDAAVRELMHSSFRAIQEVRQQIQSFITDGAISKARTGKKL